MPKIDSEDDLRHFEIEESDILARKTLFEAVKLDPPDLTVLLFAFACRTVALSMDFESAQLHRLPFTLLRLGECDTRGADGGVGSASPYASANDCQLMKLRLL